MKVYILISALFFTGTLSHSQDKGTVSMYDTDFLKAEFHQKNREKLRAAMPANSVAILFSNPQQVRSNDVDFEFHQDPNFYYFTGFREPNALLLLFKNEVALDSFSTHEIMFVPPNSKSIEIWTGKRLGMDGVKKELGFQHVFKNEDFAHFNIDFHLFSKILMLPNPFLVMQDDSKNRGDLASLMKHVQLKTAQLDSIKDTYELKALIAPMREIKSPEEIILLKKAITITCEAQKELMRALLPGNKEYQAQAVVEFVFKRNGAEHCGYPSIVGGGENSCVLHYTTNRRLLNWDELLVLDAGAEYHGYTADVTRTLPVGGEFTDEQKLIYQIVYDAQEAGIKACKKGNKFWGPHDEAKAIIQEGLISLGIIKEKAEYKKYFMHGTSHYLGLDVHDLGTYEALKPGTVITVEPGIYIAEGSDCDPKWWNIGIRIEDDVLITETGYEVLSDCVPKTIKEIEAMMKEKSVLNKMK